MQCLLTYRREHRLSLAELSAKLEISRSHAHGLETGTVKPSVDLVRKMHETLAIPLKTIVYEATT